MNFCVYPAGAWGTAMAIHLARSTHAVTLVPRELDEALQMTTERENSARLSGARFPNDLQVGTELAPSMMEAEILILACPSKFLREVCRQVRAELELASELHTVITLCKGLEEGSNLLPSEVVAEELPDLNRAVLSGPTFASQVAAGQPSAIVLAGNMSPARLETLQSAISSETLRVYSSGDLIGVELGGCLKNVYAIACGMCEGLKLRDNSRAALLTRALHELVRLGESLGGSRDTFYGLSGLGDLILTCTGAESRNRTFGQLLAEGATSEDLLEKQGMTVEGYRAAACFHAICQEKQLEAPILEQIYRILYQGRDLRTALGELMGRQLKAE